MPGKNAPGLKGFPTPENTPLDEAYLLFKFPDGEDWAQLILGAVQPLIFAYNWYEWGALTPEEAAEAFKLIVDNAPYNLLDEPVPAPYWEDGNEADDEMPADTQIWYGYVSEGNFIEDIGVWAVSNFLAATLGEKAAVLYATNERKIRLSFFNGGGVPGVIKVYADDILAQTVNLTGDADEIIDVDVITGYIDEPVEILQVLDSV